MNENEKKLRNSNLYVVHKLDDEHNHSENNGLFNYTIVLLGTVVVFLTQFFQLM